MNKHYRMHCWRNRLRRAQQGQAYVEYTIIAAFTLIGLVAATEGNVIGVLLDNLKRAYAWFLYTISLAW